MGIYTRTGDRGSTATLSGERHRKDHAVFEANGTIDELSAHLGVIRVATDCPTNLNRFLHRVQLDLVQVGAYVSSGDAGYLDHLRLGSDPFEDLIDQVLSHVTIEEFIIPGAKELEARLHLARTVCRRAERRLVALVERTDETAWRYVNRFSDVLFALALRTLHNIPLHYPD
jgi:cob(I)alamin adenosyltransferase